LLEEHEDVLIRDYYHRWIVTDANSAIQELVDLSVLLLATTDDNAFNSNFLPLVTAAYAAQVVIPHLPLRAREALVRSHFLLCLLTYITQGRPAVRPELVYGLDRYDQDWQVDRDWEFVRGRALGEKGEYIEADFIKVLRVLYECEKRYGNKENLYLNAAVKIASVHSGTDGKVS